MRSGLPVHPRSPTAARMPLPGTAGSLRLPPVATGREGGKIVPAAGDTQRPRRVLGKGRMEAFSDGVFAIAITLLVLDVAVHPPGTPLQQVLHAWPAYVAYVVSFLTIGAAWLAHTTLTDRLAHSDSIFLRLNLLLLLVVAFLPFPTRLVADALQHTDAERVAVTFYGLTLLAIRVLGRAGGVCAARAPDCARRGRGTAGRTAKTSASRHRVRDRDHHRVAPAGSGGGIVFRHRDIPGCPAPGGRTAAIPAFIGPARSRGKTLTRGYGVALGGPLPQPSDP